MGYCAEFSPNGAEVAFTYLDAIPKLKDKVSRLAEEIGSNTVLPCNVNDDQSIATVMEELSQKWGKIDFIVHAIAYADKEAISGKFINITREQFATALDTSTYSFIAVTKAAHPYLANDASLLTLSYLGSKKVVPNYNLMGVAKAALESSVRYLAADLGVEGIRVNAISAGPVKTLAASGISGFKDMLKHHEATAPMRRLTTKDEIGKASLYLLSDLAAGVTGEIHYVDGGANILGPSPIDNG